MAGRAVSPNLLTTNEKMGRRPIRETVRKTDLMSFKHISELGNSRKSFTGP
jgi:hypothetical protein